MIKTPCHHVWELDPSGRYYYCPICDERRLLMERMTEPTPAQRGHMDRYQDKRLKYRYKPKGRRS